MMRQIAICINDSSYFLIFRISISQSNARKMINRDRNLIISCFVRIQFFYINQTAIFANNIPSLQIIYISRFCHSDRHRAIIRSALWQKIFITRFYFDSIQSFSR